MKQEGLERARPPGPGFPGEIAGASLKRAAYLARGKVPETIPRRNRRGLIEARPGERSGRGRLAEFPGEIAGASLKRLADHGPHPPARRIPRRNRRGLIEAAR